MLRLEKGHVIVGQDTDGVTNPFEAGLGRDGAHGQALLHRPAQPCGAAARGTRQQLVGFTLQMRRRAPVLECHLVIDDGEHRRPHHQHRALGHAGPHHRPCAARAGAGGSRARRCSSVAMTGVLHAARWSPRPSTIRKHERQKLRRRAMSALHLKHGCAAAARLGLKGRDARRAAAAGGLRRARAPNRIADRALRRSQDDCPSARACARATPSSSSNWTRATRRSTRCARSHAMPAFARMPCCAPTAACCSAATRCSTDAGAGLQPSTSRSLPTHPDMVVMTLLAGISVTCRAGRPSRASTSGPTRGSPPT